VLVIDDSTLDKPVLPKQALHGCIPPLAQP
jgi:hypothetical protein